MRDADRTIERLLAGLRDAEPSAGMQRRILEALDGMETRQAVAAGSPWSRLTCPAVASGNCHVVGVCGDLHRLLDRLPDVFFDRRHHCSPASACTGRCEESFDAAPMRGKRHGRSRSRRRPPSCLGGWLHESR